MFVIARVFSRGHDRGGALCRCVGVGGCVAAHTHTPPSEPAHPQAHTQTPWRAPLRAREAVSVRAGGSLANSG